MTEQILEAWRINDRISLRPIERISDAGMRSTLSQRGVRTDLRQITHLHNLRIWHLTRRAKALARMPAFSPRTTNRTGARSRRPRRLRP